MSASELERAIERANADGAQALLVELDTPGGMLGIPRFHPWSDAFLKFRNNLIGDTLIDIRFHCLILCWLTGSHEPD